MLLHLRDAAQQKQRHEIVVESEDVWVATFGYSSYSDDSGEERGHSPMTFAKGSIELACSEPMQVK
jgi:hypothetical protein